MSRILIATLACLVTISPAPAQELRLKQWLSGEPGLLSPEYVTPSENRPGFLVGGGRGRGAPVFAAATVDMLCQQEEVPRITVLHGPRAGRLFVDIGPFIATGTDAGYAICVGRRVRGARVFYQGRRSRGDSVVLRVFYPPRGTPYGVTQDHVIALR
jgi:hypothetical protein